MLKQADVGVDVVDTRADVVGDGVELVLKGRTLASDVAKSCPDPGGIDLGVTVYVNEEGLLRQFPLNSRVTFLWWFHTPEARQRAMLVGNAVIIGPTDRNGDNTSVPPEVVELLMETRVYRVEVQVMEEAEWHRNQTTYTDYWEAVIWAMLLLERCALATDVRVVPVLDDNMLSLFRGDVP